MDAFIKNTANYFSPLIFIPFSLAPPFSTYIFFSFFLPSKQKITNFFFQLNYIKKKTS